MSGGISQLHTARLDEGETTPRFVENGTEESETIMDALGSDTGRSIYHHVQSEPSTPSELASVTDRSLQTVSYHISNLQSADLIQEVGTTYSDQGKEMTIWGPKSGPIVFVDDEASAKETLAKYLGAIAVLGAGGVLAQYLTDRFVASVPSQGSGVTPASYGTPPVVNRALHSLAEVLATVDVGLVVFVVGAIVLAATYRTSA